MLHVKGIRQLLEKGEYEQAHLALDELLLLGPSNVDALKLKSLLFLSEGKFTEEAQMWQKVLTTDHEDQEALIFFQRKFLEERENFYFSETLAEGGRRFLTYPRKLITASVIGLLGCAIFLFLSSYGQKYYALSTPAIALAGFGVFIITPWIMIFLAYLRSLREILITSTGICFITRLQRLDYKWEGIEQIYLAHTQTLTEGKLVLIIQPKSAELPRLSLNLSQDSSCIRARRFLLDEISRYFRKPCHTAISSIPEKDRSLKSIFF